MLLSAIEVVEQAIGTRLRELENAMASNQGHGTKEKQEIEDARRVLNLLRRESRKRET